MHQDVLLPPSLDQLMAPMVDEQEQLPEFARIRLFTDEPLAAGNAFHLSPQASHYLASVMRRRAGDRLRLFNGVDGEWTATLTVISRGAVQVKVEALSRPQDSVPDVTLLFAPIKKNPMETLVEKATELGVRRLRPILTQRTQGHASASRLRLHAIEAAEQSWRLSVPEIAEPVTLEASLAAWPSGAPLLYCDERRTSMPALEALQSAREREGPWGILIGPEGGFAEKEQALLERREGIVTVSLGPRIVRAETAAMMALTLWQSVLGDLAR